jgi:hypothetical protein
MVAALLPMVGAAKLRLKFATAGQLEHSALTQFVVGSLALRVLQASTE